MSQNATEYTTSSMLDLSLESKKGKTLIRRQRHASVHARLCTTALTPEIPVSGLVRGILSNAPEFAPTLGHTEVKEENGKTVFLLSNRRGRPSETFTDAKTQPASREDREEMFHSDGSLYTLPSKLENSPADIETLEQTPFSYGVYSKFDSFDSKGNIVHSLHPHAQGLESYLLEDLNLKRVTELAPLKVDQIRMGFEEYSPHFLGGAFGSLPEVKKRLFLEVRADRIYIFMEELDLVKGATSPFENSGSLQGLSQALSELSLYSDLYESIRNELA